MRTLTEINGKSLELVHTNMNAWKKEITESLKSTAAEGLEELTTQKVTDTITARVTESLTKRYTDSETARLTNEGKTAEEIEASLPEVIKVLVEAGLKVELPTVLEKELSKSVKETMRTELDVKVKEGVQAALEAKIGEMQKLEGEKLAQFMSVLKLTEGKFRDLKRVVVSVPLENEKAPAGLLESDGKYFLIEYFGALQSQRPDPRDSRDERGGRGGRDKKGGRDNKRGGRDGGGRSDGPRPEGARILGDRAPFGDRPARAPREQRPQATPNGVVIGIRRVDTLPSGEVMVNLTGENRAPRDRAPRAPRPPREPRAPREPRPQATPNGIVIGAGGKLMKKEDMPVVVSTEVVASPSADATASSAT